MLRADHGRTRGTAPLRACGRCTAAKNITSVIIIRAREYLCTRHQQWLRGLHRPSPAALPEITASQRRHYMRTGNIPDTEITLAHQQARRITGRWHERNQQLNAAVPGPRTLHTDVITHPEMLAVARLLIEARRNPRGRPGGHSRTPRLPLPHPLDPIRRWLS